MRPVLLIGLLTITAVAACREAPKRRCAEYDRAEGLFNELTGQVLDPTFGDPRFVAAATAFEAVPQDCERHGAGLTIAKAIRAGQAKRAAEPATTPVLPPPVVPAASAGSAPAMPDLTQTDLPEPAERGLSAEKCAAFVSQYRAGCPAHCAQQDANRTSDVCWKGCEAALPILLSRAGCAPVPSAPAPAGSAAPPKPTEPARPRSVEPAATGQTYCAYFLPDGNTHFSYCLSQPLAEAQASCQAKLAREKIEGTCDCTDDSTFIGDRCK